MELRTEYQEELDNLKKQMLSAQKFAEKFPEFSERILRYKHGESFVGDIADSYKGMPFGWGITRHFHRTSENVFNYQNDEDFEPKYLWNIYVNQANLFNTYIDTGMKNMKSSVFFFDYRNTTFYATDEQVMNLLNELAEWYAKAKVINFEYKKEKKKQDLLKELEKLS